MISFSFGDLAFNDKSSCSSIDMVVASKNKYSGPLDFLKDAAGFLDEKVNPGCNIKADFEGASLKEGLYKDIVKRWILTMNDRIEIQSSDIQKTYRIKRQPFDPCSEEFILETEDEYILFIWSTSE